MGRFVGENVSNWGDYVYVKENAVKLFELELKKLMKSSPNILLSSVTDPYHAPESKYKLTRGILELIVQYQYPGLISILTKSTAIMRDIDLLQQIPNLEVGITVTTLDDKFGKLLEHKAPINSKRIEVLKKLSQNKIRTYAFIGPLMPHLAVRKELIEDLFQEIATTGVTSIFVEHLNISSYIKTRLMKNISGDVYDFYITNRDDKKYRDIINQVIIELACKYNLKICLENVIEHHQL